MQHLKHIFLIIALPFLVMQAKAKVPDTDSIIVARGIIQEGDTIPVFMLEEVRVYNRADFNYLYIKRRDRRLVRNVKKAYPYSKLAGYELRKLDQQLASMENEKEREAYVDKAEKEIMDKFEQEVKRLTVTQGIILVKLIDRETGHTSYEVIKDLKGGITAFFWQGIARFFGNNLKAEYDPDGEDLLIEDIVQGIEAGFI
ncbi:MAG: DUF4294 domain-containing protein [Bacteroidota bacterium]